MLCYLKKNGIDVCKTVRTNKNLVPILMLTAKNDEFDRVFSLELGADDYMTKPSPREVVARVKAILRRSQFVKEVEEIDDDITIGSIRYLDPIILKYISIMSYWS